MLPEIRRDAPDAGAVAHRRLGGRLAHARVVGQAEVVVRAEQQHGLAVEQHARSLRARTRSACARYSPLLADLVQAVLDVARHAAGSTWITSGYAFGAPSGRGGTELFFLCRSCVAGFQKFASSCESISSSTGVRGRLALEPAGAVVRARVGAVVVLARHVQPELLEHLAVLLGLRAERGEEVAHHHAVQAGLDGELLELAGPRFSLRPPQRRNRASGRISRKIATHLTASQRIHQIAVAELGARARVQQVDRHGGRVRPPRAGTPSRPAARATRRG